MNGALQSFCNCLKCTNLSLAQRIGVIKEYDAHRSKKPSIKSLASKFDCCYSEIKKILLNRDSIHFAYKSVGEPRRQQHQTPTKNDQQSLKRQDIAFLGKVMYEYLQRVVYSNYPINEEKVLQKAAEFKHHLGLRFQPDKKWLDHFKLRYTIWAFDLKSLRRCIQLRETKPADLSAKDIVDHVRRREQYLAAKSSERNRNNGSLSNEVSQSSNTRQEEHILPDQMYIDERKTHKVQEDDEEPKNVYNTRTPKRSFQQQQRYNNDNYYLQEQSNEEETVQSPLEPTIVYENIDDDDDVVHRNSNSANQSLDTKSTVNPDTSKRKTTLSSIDSPEEALEHLKLLEEYAMLQDNFRAIGLLTQLEQCFKKQPKTK